MAKHKGKSLVPSLEVAEEAYVFVDYTAGKRLHVTVAFGENPNEPFLDHFASFLQALYVLREVANIKYGTSPPT